MRTTLLLPVVLLFISVIFQIQSASAASLVTGTIKVTPNTLNTNVVRKTNELVTMGVPLAGCTVTDPKKFRLFDQNKVEVPVFVKTTLYWPASKQNCGGTSARALKVQFAFDATKGTRTYTWDLAGRDTGKDRIEAPVSEIVTNNPVKASRKEPRVFAILDPEYLVQTGIAPPSVALTSDVYDAAYYPTQWSKTSRNFNYNKSVSADWLFDRVSTNYKQALRTGELAYYREAYLSHEFYISRMEVTGSKNDFCLGGFNLSGRATDSCAIIMIYLEAYKLHLALTGDDSWQPKENGKPTASGFMNSREAAWKTTARLLVTGDVRGGSYANRPAIASAGFILPYEASRRITERDLGMGLQNVINACELTLDATVCGWADTIVNNIRQMQIANPDGIKHYGYISHSLDLHEGYVKPWIGTLSTGYKTAQSITVNNALGQDYLKLTAGKAIKIGTLNAKLAGKAVKNADGSWTLPLDTAITATAGTAVYAVDLGYDTDRVFSPWMQSIVADGVWQFYNWTGNATRKTQAAAILSGFGRAYAAYALDGTQITSTTKNLIESSFNDYGAIKIFNSNRAYRSCSKNTIAPYTRYFSSALMSSASMNAKYAAYVFAPGDYSNQHIPGGIFQLSLGVLFEKDAGKKAAMLSAIQDMRTWFSDYSCSANITSPSRLYSWSNKTDPFGTFAYVQKFLAGDMATTPAPTPPPVVTPKPAPVAPKPAPVAPKPAPVAPKPAPVAPKPAPVAPAPAPAVTPKPAPVATPTPAPKPGACAEACINKFFSSMVNAK